MTKVGDAMSRLLIAVICIGVALVIASGAYARGGTYHHAEFVALTASKEHSSHHSLIRIKSPPHRHSHITHQH
jgi:hypothetical protein